MNDTIPCPVLLFQTCASLFLAKYSSDTPAEGNAGKNGVTPLILDFTRYALRFYHRAIASHESLTTACLNKVGLFNHLAHNDEALRCYAWGLFKPKPDA